MIFLDVGSHEGQTLEEVTKPRYRFDRIYAFEPMAREFDILTERFGHLGNVALFNFGLADSSGRRDLYGTNDGMEASIYPEKLDTDETVVSRCSFVRASEFVAELPDVPIYVKLNCEGAEVLILDDLIGSREIHRLANVMIDFDIRKVPGRDHEAAAVLRRLKSVGFTRFSLCEKVMIGPTHQDRIANWLTKVLR